MQQRRQANASGFNISAQTFTFLCKVSQFDYDWCGSLKVVIFRMVVEGAVSSNAKPGQSSVPLVLAQRFDFYPWSNGTNLVFKRGPALIFCQSENHLAKDFEVALKHLEYSPMLLKLSEAEATLKNSKLLNLFLLLTLLIILL
jgi:hypothetical protein